MKKALITGSSRGIGAAIARQLASDGWEVNINYYKSAEKAQALANELSSRAFCADVSDSAAVSEMFRELGPVDLLVCNAGIAWTGLLTDMTDAEWRRLFAVNVDGVFNCCREAIPHMVNAKSGCIINTASILGVAGGSCEAAYSATKGAVIALTRALAKELGPSGIRVNAVAPGAIDTDMLGNLNAEEKADIADASALCRLGRVEDIARTVSFLASENASFITGQILGADGGLVI